MKWVTRSHVHVDRVARPPLIRRFVDSQAEFLFVPAARMQSVASDTDAVPFDAPGVELGHHEGRCSFEAVLAKFDLRDPALARMGRIAHAADISADVDTDPFGRALGAIASGCSLRFPDDQENLARQFDLYDSLYAWGRLHVAGSSKASAG